MKSPRLSVGVFVLAILGAASARADVKLPAVFADHCVLQRDAAVPVWGWAAPGEQVTVEFAGQTKSATADAAGKWQVKLDNLKVGDAQKLTVKGNNTLTLSDVLVGEVWLCSGQSNMGLTVSGSKDFDKEKAAATYPNIRQFAVNSGTATTPQDDCKGAWSVCSPETVGGYSATAYFFGRELHKKLGVPVGLVHSSVGGTPIEAWTSWDAQKDLSELKPAIFDGWEKKQAAWDPTKANETYEKQQAEYKVAAAQAKTDGKPAPRAPQKPSEPRLDSHHPANLFNGKINPLVPYAIKGAIWYQGEANAGGGGPLYHLQLTTLINDWRARWGYDFPFGYVQLPDFHAPQKEPVEDDGWVFVREGMLQTLSLPKTGMAVTLGIGEADNIHPKNKQEVGRRMACWALGDVYAQKDVASSGPLVKSHEVRGNEIVIAFSHADGGLVAEGGTLKGFAIAGEDKKWVRADAKIDGDKVVVYSSAVAKPVAVRYAWAANPEFSLFNAAGLPASPFRTDSFPLGGGKK